MIKCTRWFFPYFSGRGLVVKFLHLFAVNATNRVDLFCFTAFNKILTERNVLTRAFTFHILHDFNFIFHCAICHFCTIFLVNLNYIKWTLWKKNAVNFFMKCGEIRWIIFFTLPTALSVFPTLFSHKTRVYDSISKILRII